MASTTFTYRRGAEQPALTLPWQEETSAGTWADLDLSSGFTFTLELVKGGTAVLSKTTGITGANGSVTVTWAVDDLDIAAGDYSLHLRARETATSKDRDYSPSRPIAITITEPT